MIRNFLQSCDYEHGYKKAMVDLRNWFYHHSECLKMYHMYNSKGMDSLLKWFSENAEKFMDNPEVDLLVVKVV